MNRKLSSALDTKDLSLTIYNGGFGAVKELRTVNLDGSETELIYADVAQLIETDSLLTEGLVIQEFNYEYDLVGRGKLLQKYLGQEVFLKDRKTGERRLCKLLAAEGETGCVLEDCETREIYVDSGDELILPSLPAGLLVKPALIWKIEPAKAETIKVSYLSKGFNWQANYVVELEKDTLNIVGWAQIENESGTTFPDARIKLIAGDVNRVEDDFADRVIYNKLMSSAAPAAEEKSFFEYHMYTLRQPTTLKNNQSKQICLLSAAAIPYQKHFEFDQYTEKAEVVIEFANRKASGLGLPFPKGKVKLYQADAADGSLEFIGEDELDHTPVDEVIKLVIGNAFDITFEYIELNHRKIAGFEHFTYEVKINNHRDESADIRFRHYMNGNWEMVSASHDFKQKDGWKVEFSLPVKADTEEKVRFEYKIDVRKEVIIGRG